jgi:hypothetical protein
MPDSQGRSPADPFQTGARTETDTCARKIVRRKAMLLIDLSRFIMATAAIYQFRAKALAVHGLGLFRVISERYGSQMHVQFAIEVGGGGGCLAGVPSQERYCSRVIPTELCKHDCTAGSGTCHSSERLFRGASLRTTTLRVGTRNGSFTIPFTRWPAWHQPVLTRSYIECPARLTAQREVA